MDRTTRALRVAVLVLAVWEAGFMVFDGCRALAVGDYLTPSSGPYAGQLGPWAPLVEALGIRARSTAMKLVFVGYGTAWLAACAAFVLRRPWAPRAMVAFAVGSLWYLVIGTACSVLQLVGLAWMKRRERPPSPGGSPDAGGSLHPRG